MATHSSVFARRIPWTEEPGGLHSMGLQSRKHDRNDLARRQACSKHQLRADVEGGDPQVGEVSPCTDSHFQFPLLLEPGTRFTYVASLWRELGGGGLEKVQIHLLCPFFLLLLHQQRVGYD